MPHERIEQNPDVMGGKPVVRGTRIPVEMILRKLGGGMTADELLANHPRLTPEDIRVAQAFAADYLACKVPLQPALDRKCRDNGSERRDPYDVLRDGAALHRAMVAAQRRTVLRHRRLGVPLVVWQDGRVVELDPDEVELPGEE